MGKRTLHGTAMAIYQKIENEDKFQKQGEDYSIYFTYRKLLVCNTV